MVKLTVARLGTSPSLYVRKLEFYRSALNILILSSSSRSDCRLLILDLSENKIFTGKSILWVSPVFFGDEAAIKHKLIELGADVTYVDDRPNNNSFFKGIVRG